MPGPLMPRLAGALAYAGALQVDNREGAALQEPCDQD